MAFLFNNLLIMANNVSDSGTPRIKAGTKSENTVTFLNSSNDRMDMINPKNNAPVSPIKILAG